MIFYLIMVGIGLLVYGWCRLAMKLWAGEKKD